MRKVIVHKHLFKNAGTTFDSILKDNFGDCFYDHRDDKEMRKFGRIYLELFLLKHRNIMAISSHHIWFKISCNFTLELIPVYFLRHPIERIMSVYKFERIQPLSTPGSIMAKKLDFYEYVRWRLSDNVSPVIRNFQTRNIAGIKTNGLLDEKVLKTGIEEIRKNPLVGVVDKFDESMVHFEKEFKKMGININCTHFKAQNVNQPINDVNVYERSNEILNILGDLADEVLEQNTFDIKLYELAKERITTK